MLRNTPKKLFKFLDLHDKSSIHPINSVSNLFHFHERIEFITYCVRNCDNFVSLLILAKKFVGKSTKIRQADKIFNIAFIVRKVLNKF